MGAEAAARLAAIVEATTARTQFEMRRSLVERQAEFQAELAHKVEERHAADRREAKRAAKQLKAIQASAESRTVARTTPAKHPGQLEELREASRKEERGKMLHASKKLHELQAKAAPKVERSLRASYTDHLDHFEQEAAEQRRAEQAAVKATSKKIQQIQQRAAPRTEVVLSDSHAQAREEHAAPHQAAPER